MRPSTVLIVIGTAVTSVTGSGHGSDPVAAAPRFDLRTDLFEGNPAKCDGMFTALATDFDLDRDDDLLIHRHNQAPLELWRNDGGRFRSIDPASSGIFEQPGIPTLYATDEEMLARIDALNAPGLFVWHRVQREAAWRLHVRPAPGTTPLEIEVHTNRNIWRAPEGQLGVDRRSVRFTVEAGRSSADFHVTIRGESQRFHVQGDSDELLPIHVGPDLVPVGGELDVWSPDPHGIAWVDVEGTPHPELYVGRGGLTGELSATETPKVNRFFVWRGAPALYELLPPERFAPDHGRARQVQWVDFDRDGVLELYVGNRDSPNALLVAKADGTYVDRAIGLGLALRDGQAFAWLDLDDDRREDLLSSDAEVGLRILLNRGPSAAGAAFVEVERAELGLALGDAFEPPDAKRLFESLMFHAVDVDLDGRLDLLVTGLGEARRILLFLRRDDRFQEATRSAGLAEVEGVKASLMFDVDGDRYEDLVALTSADTLLWLGRPDGRFERADISKGWSRRHFGSGCVADVDGDGREDLVLIARARHVALNRTPVTGTTFSVRFDRATAIGALVTAHYADGRSKVQRYGSARSSPYSQALAPLRFALPAASSIAAVDVLLPGSDAPQSFVVGPDSVELIVAN